MEFDTQRLRDIRIVGLLGLPETGRMRQIKCVFDGHKADNTPSLSIWPDNHFHCFGCDKHGKGAIDFVMNLMPCDFKTAITHLKGL